jgi:hypothetical protein
METAKVDIRKLQFLNDRINQTIDALNQVRLSVHGLSHSAAQLGALGGGQGMGVPGAYPQSFQGGYTPGMQGGFPGAQAGNPGLQGGFPQSFVPGLSHSPMQFSPYGVPGVPGLQASQGFGANPLQTGFGQQAGVGASPWATGGLSHTGLETENINRPVWNDPLFAARLQQTFPYAQYAVPPVVTLY